MPRLPNDNYETPQWAVNALLENHRLPFPVGKVLEPCAGSGAIIRAFYSKYWPWRMEAFKFTAIDIRQQPCDVLPSWADKVHCADFLTWEPDEEYSVIITNPPYSIAQEIVEHALEIARRQTKPAEVIMLLRLAFLESEKRYDFWQKNPPNKVLVLSSRPSFTGDGGTDATAYAWFVWTPDSHSQEIRVIDSPTRPRKRR